MQNEVKYHNKEEALAALTKIGSELQLCSPYLQNDEEVVRATLKQHGWAFCFASKELKSNKLFIMEALHAGVYTYGLVEYANVTIQSDLEVLTLALEKSNDGWEFSYAQGEIAFNKELAAKALVKWGAEWGAYDLHLWKNIHPTLQEFFPKNCWYEKAQSYLYQMEQERQAELMTGGSTEEDEIVW